MADKKLKLKAEAKVTPKPKPSMPKPGMGPKIDAPPSGPKINVPQGLQKEVVDYKPRGSAAGVRGVAAETVAAKEAAKSVRGVGSEALKARNMIPAKVQAPIRLPAQLPAQAAKSMTVDTTATKVAKQTISRAKVAEMGVKESVKPGKVFPPKPLQLPAGEIKQVAKAAAPEAKVVQPAKETTKAVVKQLGEITKRAGKALAQNENPYRQAGRAAAKKVLSKVGIELGAKQNLSTLGKIKAVGKVAVKGAKAVRVAGRVAARVSLPYAVAEGIVAGTSKFYKMSSEYNKGLSALAGTDHQASRLQKKAGVKVTRPELTYGDVLGMTFIPGYNSPASDPNQMRIYDSSGNQISGSPRKKRR